MKHLVKYVHHFFIPHEKNNYRAKALHFHALTTYLIFFIAFGFFVNMIQKQDNVLGYATDISVDKLFELTNKKREENGLPRLTYNDKLAVAAQKKAEDMFAKNYWSHYAPDGTTPWSFILAAGYKYEYAGENLAKNFMFSDGVVEAWMNSPTHRENLLRPEYTDIGFAISNGVLNGEETTLVVQEFGAPYGGVPQVQAEENNLKPAGAENPAQDIQPQVVEQPQVNVNPNNILAEQKQSPSFFKLFYNANMFFLFFLILAFILDMFVAVKLNLIHMRVTGKNLVHIIFLLFIMAGMLIVVRGKIL